HQETLAVIEHDRREIEAERSVTLQGIGRVVRQDIDLAGLQGGEALLGSQGHILDLVRGAKDCRGQCSADIDIEAGPVALAVGRAKTGDAGRHAAADLAGLLDLVERRSRLRRRRETEREADRSGRAQPTPDYHYNSPLATGDLMISLDTKGNILAPGPAMRGASVGLVAPRGAPKPKIVSSIFPLLNLQRIYS